MARAICLYLLLVLVPGCVSTQTQLASVDPQIVKAEEGRQRALAIRTLERQQSELDSIAWPLLVAAAPFCETAPQVAFRAGTRHAYRNEWQTAARDAVGLGDTLMVVGVTPGGPAAAAGLLAGDLILAIVDERGFAGPYTGDRFGKAMEKARRTPDVPLRLEVLRAGEVLNIAVPWVMACPYHTVVIQDGSLNAFADGKAVYVTTAMMRFADPLELAVIVGHEIAHNAMGHLDAKKSNVMAGGFLGLLADIALATQGVNTGGRFTAEGMQAGAMVFSQDFEREADYVGLYILALAGIDVKEAPTFWRHMAIASPGSIAMAVTHPTTAERFIRLEQVIAEIELKKSAGEPLRPEMKKGTDVQRGPGAAPRR
jgi:beta-barrel assembly-enhancing protease